MKNNKIIKKVLGYKDRKFLTIPKNSNIITGDYVIIQKVNLENQTE